MSDVMWHWSRAWISAGLLLAAIGCGGGEPPAPKELSADEEKEFERQQKEGRRGETRDRE